MPVVAVLAGPTASGKTALALAWAKARGLEILSADSRQIYRGLAIGSGAPTQQELRDVPHHLVACTDPKATFSPRRFRNEAETVVAARPETRFLVVGGSGLYLREWMYIGTEERGETPRAIREAADATLAERGLPAVHAELAVLDPEGMRRVDPHDAYRIRKRLENWMHTGRSYALPRELPPLNPLFRDAPFLWLDPDRKALHARIAARVEAMFRRGWADEVRALLRDHDPMRTPALNAIGYREIAALLAQGKDSPEAAMPTIVARTRQYAKKQTTFFRHQFPGGSAWDPGALHRALMLAEWNPNALSAPGDGAPVTPVHGND